MRKFLILASVALAAFIAACQSAAPRPPAATAPASATVATRPAAHDFAKWEKDVAAFEAADRLSPPPPNPILFVGSSTIVHWKTLPQDFSGQPILNRGFGGNHIIDSTHFADRIIFPYRPRMIFLRAGGNELWAGKSPEQVFADYREFVATVHSKLPTTDIVYMSVFPTIARWREADKEKSLNSMIEAYTRGKRLLKYIETFDITLGPDGQPRPELFVSDKLHLSPAGYKLLIERVRPYLPQ